MTERRIFCDICKTEVKYYSDLENIILDTKSGGNKSYEVCRSCRKKIIDYIESLKK